VIEQAPEVGFEEVSPDQYWETPLASLYFPDRDASNTRKVARSLARQWRNSVMDGPWPFTRPDDRTRCH
jgi:hypothetical protein